MIDLSVAKPYIEMLYLDKCTVKELRSVKDETTGITSMEEVTVYENIPCKLSFNRFPQTGDGVVGSLSFLAKLIMSPDYEIKEGSKIIVVKNGKTYTLSNAGIPAMYHNHQEINVNNFERYA